MKRCIFYDYQERQPRQALHQMCRPFNRQASEATIWTASRATDQYARLFQIDLSM